MLQQIGDRFYATSKAYIVDGPQDMPREMASDFKMDRANSTFLWIAGRYVQANNANRNGHYWTFDDLKSGEGSIVHTPVNALHEWDRPIGTVVQTKIVQREGASAGLEHPEIQALSVVWAMNFPEAAAEIRESHKQGTLFYSMECVAESKQCLACEQIFPYAAAAADVCDHLAGDMKAPRRFINPTFLGAGLIFPPERPAWPDAEVTDVAKLVEEYANRNSDVARWESLMDRVMSYA